MDGSFHPCAHFYLSLESFYSVVLVSVIVTLEMRPKKGRKFWIKKPQF